MSNMTVGEVIQFYSRQNPEKIAVIGSNSQKITFQDLNQRISKVARLLQSHNISEADSVVVIMPNGSTMAITCLGIMANAVCCPLNPEYHEPEFDFFLTDLAPKLIITLKGLHSPVIAVANKLTIPILEISEDDFSDDKDETAATSYVNDPKKNALILYTSGTSSKPKMVSLTHINIIASCKNISKSLKLDDQDCCLNMMPIFHVGGLVCLFLTPLSVGGSVICSGNFSSPDFFKYIKSYKPTWFQAAPAMLQDILEHLENRPNLEFKHNLRFIRIASAALPNHLEKQARTTFDVPIIEIYGMTESCGLIVGNSLNESLHKTGSVGIPVKTKNIAVVDENFNRLPANQIGDLIICGKNVIKSYSNLSEEENRQFFRQGWLNTGDTAYFDNDGYLFLTGRKKDIINRGGEKCSPAEVDKVLLEHPGISQAAVFPVKVDKLGEEVAAVITLKNGVILDSNEIKKFVSQRLAYFKVPKFIFFVDDIPKNASGKISRKDLSELYNDIDSYTESTKSYTTENKQTESSIAISLIEIWQTILNVNNINISDNFFDLGGDSLQASALINDLNNRWGINIYVSTILEYPTIKELETYLQQQHPEVNSKIEKNDQATSKISTTLSQMWQELLNVNSIGINDNFFELGGDSLQAAVFLNEIQEKWGVFIYVSAIFEFPTIKEFVQYLQQQYPELIEIILAYKQLSSQVSQMIAKMWQELLDVNEIGPDDNFFELGGDSLKASTFLNKIQDKWGVFVYVSAVFESPTIREFEAYLIDQYPELIEKITGKHAKGKVVSKEGVSDNDIATMREKIKPTINHSFTIDKNKNPSAIFILSTPRSGSTLLRAMLGGHSKLFAPPELQLLSFSTLQDRANWFSDSQQFMLEGNIRALMQIHNETAEQSKSRMLDLENKNISTQTYYGLLQQWLNDKILVDKTPAYALNTSTLECAEKYFENPLYIRLCRHPYGMIRSFEESKLDQLWYSRLVGKEANIKDSPYQSHQLAELIWLILNDNISTFLKNIPKERQHTIKFENLVSQPERAIDSLCDFIGINPEPAMLTPQTDISHRMTDGIHESSRMIGDMKFHLQKGINADNANLWKTHYKNDFLNAQTIGISQDLLYEETVASENEIEEFTF